MAGVWMVVLHQTTHKVETHQVADVNHRLRVGRMTLQLRVFAILAEDHSS